MRNIFNEVFEVLLEASKPTTVNETWSESVKISSDAIGPFKIDGKTFKAELRFDFDNYGVRTKFATVMTLGSEKFAAKDFEARSGRGYHRAGKMVQISYNARSKANAFSLTIEGDLTPFDTADWAEGDTRKDRSIKSKSVNVKVTFSGSREQFEKYFK